MEILPLPSRNEPITNVVRYLSQPPVIVQKAMAGQARAPGGQAKSDSVVHHSGLRGCLMTGEFGCI